MTTPPETPTPRTDALSPDLTWKELLEKHRQLERENIAFRNAQKACEDCDGPTMEKVRQMEHDLAEAQNKIHQLNLDIAEIRRQYIQEVKEWKSDEELITDRDRWRKMAEDAIASLKANRLGIVLIASGQFNSVDTVNLDMTANEKADLPTPGE